MHYNCAHVESRLGDEVVDGLQDVRGVHVVVVGVPVGGVALLHVDQHRLQHARRDLRWKNRGGGLLKSRRMQQLSGSFPTSVDCLTSNYCKLVPILVGWQNPLLKSFFFYTMFDFSQKCCKYKMFKLVRTSIDIINIFE